MLNTSQSYPWFPFFWLLPEDNTPVSFRPVHGSVSRSRAKKKDMESEKLSFKTASAISIVETLEKMGYHPARINRQQAWYLSPLRSETRASFNVSLAKNLWYDFGIGRGGNVIDLVAGIRKCSRREALEYLSDSTGSLVPVPRIHFRKKTRRSRIRITKVSRISHPGLTRYLVSRNIPPGVAGDYCRQVRFQLREKEYDSLGLQNHLGGWELRNRNFKSSTSPKTYSHLRRSAKHLLITEGMFDFLSLATLDPDLVRASDTIILNSLSFLDPVRTCIAQYRTVDLFLDNDTAGTRATRELLNSYDHLTDKSQSYGEYKDLNEMLQARS